MLVNINSLNLKYQDAAFYCAIKSFRNIKKDKCFPAYETIAGICGVDRKLVKKSVDRLENAGLFKVKRGGKKGSNKYFFPDFKKGELFERIPHDVFLTPDLRYTEVATLICIRQFFIHGGLNCLYKVPKMADLLGITRDTLRPQINSLVKKGYIEKVPYKKQPSKGFSYHLTNKIDWEYDYSKPGLKKPAKILLKVG